MVNWISLISKVDKKRNIKYINIFNSYYSIVYFKWINKNRIIEKDKSNYINNVSLLNIKYINYTLMMKKLDFENNKGLDILNVKNNKKYLDIMEDNNVLTQPFKVSSNNVVKNEEIKLIYKNIWGENKENIELRKIANRLVTPYFFFTSNYTEKSQPTQIKHWVSSVYNFNKWNKVNGHYLDYYTEKLINSFFNINMIRVKNIWSEKFLMDGYKLLPNENIIKDMNILINYTSARTNKSLKSILSYSKSILNHSWFKEKINFSNYIKGIIKDRKTLKLGGFFAKKKIELDYNNRALLSKPIFKHTSSNLIIDLFLFNNKKYLFNKLDHLIWRRIMYKYMYSMYINYISKINETINRPRFFYINILEPKIFSFYTRILKEYENLLILKSKIHLIYLCLFILKLKNLFLNNNSYLMNKNNLKRYISNSLNNTIIKSLKKDFLYDLNNSKYKNIDKVEEKKKEYLFKSYKSKDIKNSWLLMFLNKFYLFNNKIRINLVQDKRIKDFLNTEESVFKKSNETQDGLRNKRIYYNINNIKIFKNFYDLKKIKGINQYNNSKILWDNLDFSLISILNQILSFRKDGFLLNQLSVDLFTLVVNKSTISSDMFYYINKLNLIEKEFYLINKDVINTSNSNTDVIYDFIKNDVNSYYVFKYNIKDKIILNENSNKYINLYIWRLYFDNKRKDITNSVLNNLIKLFKPYYRSMISIFILESYKSLLSYIGYKNFILLYSKYLIKNNNFKWFNFNMNVLYNYVIVKVLLNLFRYNYQSLIKVKSKFYYINRLRFYESKIRRLKLNTWLSSIKYLKKFRNTPRNFWKRYHKLIALYFGRIIQNAELDTKRKIFTPFLIYFEDILFIIYNKPSIIRLWPLKRYFLSSVILVKRIMSTILMRQHKVSLGGYRKVIRKLISTFRALEIKKAYDYYISNNNRWPINLINKLDILNNSSSLKYDNLEYYSKKEDRYHFLNVYFLSNYNLSNYISNFRNDYIQCFWNNISKLKLGVKKQIIKSLKRSNISTYNYSYYWVKPLKNYIIEMRRNIDISGIKFKLAGRSGIRRNNMRKFKKTKYFGNLKGPVHSSMRVRKNISLYNPQLIGHLKSNIDYSYGWGITKNGNLSLKIWISSLFSVDLRELLLHLVKIKHLYYELINRYYLVETKLMNLSKNYYLTSINDVVNKHRKNKESKRYENKKYLPNRWSFKYKKNL